MMNMKHWIWFRTLIPMKYDTDFHNAAEKVITEKTRNISIVAEGEKSPSAF